MPGYYPIFLNLSGKRCLVVGAGQVARRKIASLLEAGASVVVVSPEADERVRAWAAEGRLTWKKKKFEPGDLEGCLLVIGATGDREVNRQAFRAAEEAGLLANIVDDPELCNFYLPAVVQRGEFQVAISTGGASPLLARRVREDLEKRFGPDFGELVGAAAELRQWLRERVADPGKRRAFWEDFIDLEYFYSLHGGDLAGQLRERAQKCLSRLED
ncbi:MAG: bifunctional precorrin-2 dehydrogenase/sirohydrochlorin ferrochelatase [Candidatus Glassbacteria bacterium]|nr:bifunctional precorrin-2 dehydrogenase/sirohydrochlorin ferrochelatase [Candidatus Glassbacteria bacterium]